MKLTSFLIIILFLICSISSTLAQQLHIIELNTANKFLVSELQLDLSPGDSLQFKSVDGDFAIYVENAISFLSIKEPDLKVRVNADNTESEIYIVRKVIKDIEKVYSVYCLTSDSWPDAPPRIIIVTQK